MFVTILIGLYVFILCATIICGIAYVKINGGSWTDLLDYCFYAFIPLLNLFTLIGLINLLSATKPFQSEVFKKD